MLVSGPLELGGVGVPGAHVLGLQMLHLGENIVAISHLVYLNNFFVLKFEIDKNSFEPDVLEGLSPHVKCYVKFPDQHSFLTFKRKYLVLN